MCEAVEKWYKDGEAYGEKKGEAKGETKAKKETAHELQEMGLSIDKIAKALKSTKRPSDNGWVRNRPRHKIIPRWTH